ncbi:MAG TPA: 30S ribosomal protein S9 [Thermodesulfovibrionia bacterium]|nr:30S ribosomal protein S9 [Thermodesulfovibrionia bacterium]
MAGIQYAATGRRKTSVARVIIKPGTGVIEINNKPMDKYFPQETLKMIAQQPIGASGAMNKYDVKVNVNGGGLSGQAGAIKHGIARALVKLNPDHKGVLRKSGFLTRDPRSVERKKYGQKGARKRFQFSKR